MKRLCIALLLLSACDSNPAPKTPTAEGGGTSAAPAPEQFCEHVAEILDGDMATAKTKAEKADARKACLDRANAEQRDEPARWSCESGCTMAATSFEGLRGCDEKCKH